MPATSGKQFRLMAMAAHDPDAAKRVGISQSVAEEFVHKTPASKRSQWSSAKRRAKAGIKKRRHG
jgi:hypothetical protein